MKEAELQAVETVNKENSKKLDRVIVLLEGSGPEVPGLIHRINMHERLLLGENGDAGIAHRVAVMWRMHVWLLCTFSAGLGFLLKELSEIIFK